ncbi:biotin--[acetyl-CoA-carboxylase] ligase, partial [Candidatus Aerophobetes bacterium]|nr:biotin--[acetyl-CoA-carboxylase] ligase [Candidatus Aerophobetes bacterium]
DRQLKGEGRRGGEWFSPEGGLWFSLILRPECRPELTSLYPFIASVAVIKVVEKLYSLSCRIKWPNDVLIGEKKVAGAMCRIKLEKNFVKFAIVGVGVNLNVTGFPSELQNRATSLLLESSRMGEPSLFLDFFLKVFEDIYIMSKNNLPGVLEKIKEFLPAPGTRVKVSHLSEDKIAVVKSIDLEGCLLLEVEDEVRKISPDESFLISFL